MATNILEVPFRRTHNVDVSSAIKQYISTKYDQHPEMFADDLRQIDALRRDAINVQDPHTSGIRRLTLYAAQLRYIGGKFPIDIGVDFPWYPALGFHTDKPVLQNNVRFELANVLFNLAALYSQLAFANNRTTAEGLKQAAAYGVAAAGTLSFLRTDVLPDMRSTPPDDMDAMTLESLEKLCLAQAQECFWQKAVKDGMKDGTIARLAAKVSDYYSEAADAAVQSDAVSTEWIHHFQAKHHHFAAAAQFRQSRDCLEKRKYGEEVARLKDSIVCVNEALKEARWINKTVLGDLNGLKMRVTEELKRAEKDNDVIYLLPVPPKSELKALERANMVTAKPPAEVANGIAMLGHGQPFGPPLFENLVPYAVHQAASIYADRRDRLVNQSIIVDLETMTAQLRDLLQSLNLPGSLQALEKPLGLPPSLISKAEELRQQDAMYRLKRSLEDTTKLKTNDLAIYQEGLSLLEAERAEDERLRQKYGTDRWPRPPSTTALAKLYQQSKDLQTYLNSAGSSDTLIQTKMRENDPVLRILTGSNRDIESFVPSSRHVQMTPAIETAASKLRGVLNDISRLETRRKKRIEALREKAAHDDINAALLAEASRLEREFPMQKIEPGQFEPLFEARLAAFDEDRETLQQEQDEQDELAARVRDANSGFLAARHGDSSTRDREKALQTLENAYLKYKEIINNIDTGRKFYNDLAGHVTRFREGCKSQVQARRVEASQLEAELAGQDLGRLKLEETRRDLGGQKQQTTAATASSTTTAAGGGGVGVVVPGGQPPPPSSSSSSSSPQQQLEPQQQQQQLQEALTAPVPTRANAHAPGVMQTTSPLPVGVAGGTIGGGGVWNPDMGIRFGGASQGGYPAPRRPG